MKQTTALTSFLKNNFYGWFVFLRHADSNIYLPVKQIYKYDVSSFLTSLISHFITNAKKNQIVSGKKLWDSHGNIWRERLWNTDFQGRPTRGLVS